MKVELLHATPLVTCLRAAKTCRNSDNPERALKHALKVKHNGLKEHWIGQFHVSGISRILSHQLVRKRIASYAQASQRHIEGFDCVTPQEIKQTPEAITVYMDTMRAIDNAYHILIEQHGISIESARYVLPGAATTEVTITMNARSLCEFFQSRLCKRAQTEIREMASLMFGHCYREAPTLFNGVYPDCSNCPEPCK